MASRAAWIVLFLSGTVAASEPPADRTKVRIVLAGDSTVTDDAGWGKGFAKLLTGDVEVVNLSKGGRSSKSYRAEGWWKKCLELKPNYILIQFGHNDQPGKGPERETDPETTFRDNIIRYVDEARAAGATPIVVTSLSRRQWGKDAKIQSTLVPYVESVKKLAAEREVPLIDLHARSIELYEKMGRDGCLEISPRTEKDGVDGTHLNARGAEVIAPLVASELRRAVPALARFVEVPAPPRQDLR